MLNSPLDRSPVSHRSLPAESQGAAEKSVDRPLLTASLIVRNEEEFLVGCLDSLRSVVDEIVIVDTGSTDRSKKIAESAGARICDLKWTGDFSEARNRALDLSTGQWI